MQEQEPYFNPDYQHGFQSGVEKLDKGHFEGFLSTRSNEEWLRDRLSVKQQALNDVSEEIKSSKQQHKNSFDQLQQHMASLSVQSKEVSFLQKKFNDIEADLASIKNRHLNASTPYSFMAGVVYLLAGIAFVLGDLIISHEIVAYALNIHDNTEAWAFAVGLAMLSVLLKPAYERLIEEPYLKEKSARSQKIYSYFQGFLLFFAVGTMFILGWFRYEAYRTDQLKSGITQQIKTIQGAAQPIDPSQATPEANQQMIGQMEQQLKRFDELNTNLVNSPWALASFVLSGILFAVAGAICLGIAFPILQAYWFRWLQASPKIKHLKKEQTVTANTLLTAEKQLAEEIFRKNVLENDLGIYSDLSDKEAEKAALQNEIDEISNHLKMQNIESRIAQFNDGYGRGMATQDGMSDDEAEEFRKRSLAQLRNIQPSKNDQQQRIVRSNGLRPYEALRKSIAEQ